MTRLNDKINVQYMHIQIRIHTKAYAYISTWESEKLKSALRCSV